MIYILIPLFISFVLCMAGLAFMPERDTARQTRAQAELNALKLERDALARTL